MVFEYGHGPILAVAGSSHVILLSSPGIKSLPGALHKAAANFVNASAMPVSPPPYGLDLSIGMGILSVIIQGAMSRHFASRLPKQVAIHFGLSGQPNGYSSKKVALWLGPSISFGLGVLGILVSLPAASNIATAGIFAAMECVMVLVFWWMFRMNVHLSSGT